MAKPYLLPLYYIRKNIRNRFYSEKYLIILLLFLSIVTVFIILQNLPSDIQKVVNKSNIQNVFIPEVNDPNHQHQHHQHPPPPIFDENEVRDLDVKEEELNNESFDKPGQVTDVTLRRNKIKEV